MRALGIGLIFLPLAIVIIGGLIFVPISTLVALGLVVVLVAPMFAGFYLLVRFGK